MGAEAADLGRLIERAQAGDRDALEELFAATYQDLKALARSRLRASPRMTVLNTTALVNESYVRLTQAGRLKPQDRAHFVRYAARAMRSVVIDFVRRRTTGKRGGDQQRLELTTGVVDGSQAGDDEILRVHEALEELGAINERMVKVVELRYFCGLSDGEIAAALGIGERTVRRDWDKARLFLAEALER